VILLQADTDVSEEHLPPSPGLKMEVVCFSETSVLAYKTTGCHNPGGHCLKNRRLNHKICMGPSNAEAFSAFQLTMRPGIKTDW
jgi:hypothetical protein